MTNLEEMWATLTAYQPQADAAGHGDSWAKMCKEKTAAAAFVAEIAAYDAVADADAYVADAYAAADAANAAYAASYAVAEKRAQRAIDCINKVLVKPAPLPAQPVPEVDINRLHNFYFTPPGGEPAGPYLLKLELAAKAAGIEYRPGVGGGIWIPANNKLMREWNPLTDDGDALRLAQKLNIVIDFNEGFAEHWSTLRQHFGDNGKTVHHAVVSVAAEIGKASHDQ